MERVSFGHELLLGAGPMGCPHGGFAERHTALLGLITTATC